MLRRASTEYLELQLRPSSSSTRQSRYPRHTQDTSSLTFLVLAIKLTRPGPGRCSTAPDSSPSSDFPHHGPSPAAAALFSQILAALAPAVEPPPTRLPQAANMMRTAQTCERLGSIGATLFTHHAPGAQQQQQQQQQYIRMRLGCRQCNQST